jgi:hypothetical protein
VLTSPQMLYVIEFKLFLQCFCCAAVLRNVPDGYFTEGYFIDATIERTGQTPLLPCRSIDRVLGEPVEKSFFVLDICSMPGKMYGV